MKINSVYPVLENKFVTMCNNCRKHIYNKKKGGKENHAERDNEKMHKKVDMSSTKYVADIRNREMRAMWKSRLPPAPEF